MEYGKPYSFLYKKCRYRIFNGENYDCLCNLTFAFCDMLSYDIYGSRNQKKPATHYYKGARYMQFLTISAAAKEIGIPQSRLRTMQAQHKLPGFYAASRYYVNLDLLKQQLETECRVNAGMEVQP